MNAARSSASRRSPWWVWALGALAGAGALAAVVVVHATGQTLLATVLLAMTALTAWTYSSQRTHALRYLLPAIGAALVFVIFPMLYTVGIGFTNQSTQNLFTPEKARAVLTSEAVTVAGSRRRFTLHPDGDLLRLRLEAEAPAAAAVTPPLDLRAGEAGPREQRVALEAAPATPLAPALPLAQVVPHLDALRALTVRDDGGRDLKLVSVHEFAQQLPLYTAGPDGSLVDRVTGTVYREDRVEGFFTSAQGDRLQPGFRVGVGFRHYASVFSEGKFREPFFGVFVWTVVFAALSVVFAAGLGLLLAVMLNWEALEARGLYRLVLFLPYAVPGFISILIFKGLFNQNLGEINLILSSLFGIRPAWFSDPLMAKLMLLIVNVWLGFPYMMVLCSGLIKSVPADLYEASAVVGAGPWVNFTRITMPLIVKPLTPLLISAFAFNFNNFVLVSLLTNGRPDQVDSTLPAGTTDILVSYTWRIAFQDNGQQFGLAAAISTVIFLMVAAVTLIQMKLTLKEERR